MTNEADRPGQAEDKGSTRAFAQLLRQQERIIKALEDLRDELEAPTTRALIREARKHATRDVEEALGEVRDRVQETLRAAQVCQSEIHRELMVNPGRAQVVDGPSNLPPVMARFLAERQRTPGFTYELREDEVRGWIIHWKEYTHRGTVRGSGQFYERPYAWIDE
jgi:vacuolar-type H+-ATPase subunit H